MTTATTSSALGVIAFAKHGAALLSIALLSCASSQAPVTAPRVFSAEARAVEPRDLRATLRAPEAFSIDDTAVGMNEGIVSVTITNAGPEAAQVGMLHIAFHLHRGEVELPCLPRKSDFADNASVLRAGESFTVTTPLGCWTPIAGEYRARATVSFGSASASTQEIPFTIRDPRGRAAHASPTHPGLFALAGGDRRFLPIGEEKAAKGQYGITIVLTNANAEAMRLPSALVSLRVYRLGEEIACIGETFTRTLTPLIGGGVAIVHVPVTCIRDVPGDYVVATNVAFVGEGEASDFEAGRVRVKITRDATWAPWESPHGDRDRW